MRKKDIRNAFLSVIGCVSITVGCLQNAALAGELDEFGDLTDAERVQFEEYLAGELAYQETVPREPKVVDHSPRSVQDGAIRPGSGFFTSNPERTDDNRIGALFISTAPLVAERYCTANYIGGKFWLTAHHCVDDLDRWVGFIQQADGEVAGIENIYMRSENDDVALIKVGSGISADAFSLSTKGPELKDRLDVIGYGVSNPYSSRSSMRVTETKGSYIPSGRTIPYHNVFTVEIAAPFRYSTVGGDSGAAAHKGNVAFGVLSGGNKVFDRYADLQPHLDWVKRVMAESSTSSTSEIFRSFRGGVAAAHYGRVDDIKRPKLFDGSSEGSSY